MRVEVTETVAGKSKRGTEGRKKKDLTAVSGLITQVV